MISVEQLEVVYPSGTRALAPTSMEFEAGAFTVLLGPSGAGKSTLLRSLNALVRPSSGRVVVDGIGELSGSRAIRLHRRRTGMIFQQHQVIGRATVLANVLMGRLGYHSGMRTLLPFPISEKQRALDAIERVGLLECALQRCDQLSGGQQQRVGIARALVQEPALILADEPVASLDPATAERVLNLLHGICKADGISAIVSLHQVGFARRYADRIVGLSQGAVVFDGAPAKLGRTETVRIYGADPAIEDDAYLQPTDLQPTELKTGTFA